MGGANQHSFIVDRREPGAPKVMTNLFDWPAVAIRATVLGIPIYHISVGIAVHVRVGQVRRHWNDGRDGHYDLG